MPVQNGPEPSQAAFPAKTSVDTVPLANQEPGNVTGLLLKALTLPDDSKAYVILRVGDKEVKTKWSVRTAHPEWNESFNLPAGPLTPKLFAWVHEHKTLGKDRDLGAADVDLWNLLQLQEHSSKEITLPLRNGGNLKLLLEFNPTVHPSMSATSLQGERSMHRTISFSSPSRFSIRGRRPAAEDD